MEHAYRDKRRSTCWHAQACALIAVVLVLFVPEVGWAQFDWRDRCEGGTGEFALTLLASEEATAGEIPAGKRDVRVNLESLSDLDIRLVDIATGVVLVGWNDGLIREPGESCADYEGMLICYSGFEGVDGEPGKEWIRIDGLTTRVLRLDISAYESGDAELSYAFDADPTCNERGSGSFDRPLQRDALVEVGTIPAGKTNVRVALSSSADLDLNLFDGPTLLVGRAVSGAGGSVLSGATRQEASWEGLRIVWSGYDGDGTGSGHEFIEIWGELAKPLKISAYAFRAGTARVEYEFGRGTGEPCEAFGAGRCVDGLVCKDPSEDPQGGTCHSRIWCLNDELANQQCGNGRPPRGGRWTCRNFECSFLSDGAAGAYESALVDLANRCLVDRLVGEFYDEVQHNVEVFDSFYTQLAVGAEYRLSHPNVAVDTDLLRACAEDLAQPYFSCMGMGRVTCDDAFRGTRRAGQGCAMNAECASGACSTDGQQACGQCIAKAEAVAACSSDWDCGARMWCDSASGQCTAKAKLAAPCGSDAECLAPYQCAGEGPGLKGVCARLGAVGDSCVDVHGTSLTCLPGLLCDADSKLCRQPQSGEACQDQRMECGDGTICTAVARRTYRCQAPQFDVGQSCDPSSGDACGGVMFTGLACVKASSGSQGTCQHARVVEVGEACDGPVNGTADLPARSTVQRWCRDGFSSTYCDTSSGAQGVCRARPRAGQECNVRTKPCEFEDSYCVPSETGPNRCVALPQRGQPCLERLAPNCAPGLVCERDIAGAVPAGTPRCVDEPSTTVCGGI